MAPCIDPNGRSQAEEASFVDGAELEKSGARAQVGVKAPNFQATALIDGGFEDIKLSDYEGDWLVLNFFPAAFTFV